MLYAVTRGKSLLLLIFALAISAARSSGQDILLGVLEDQPGWYAGEPNFRAVRVVFKKSGPDWQSFPGGCPDQGCLKRIASAYPREVTWTVTFDGRNLGEITSRAPTEFQWYAGIGQEEITSTGPVPTVGERSEEFGGFTGRPSYRPLVANSHAYYEDPDAWKPTQLSSDLAALLRERFRKKFPRAENCVNPDENVLKPWPYRDENIKVLKSYSARNGWSISRLELDPYRCDGPAGDPFLDYWFAISPQREVEFLDSGMWLVDAGDYDHDGKSELLFSIDRYNRGGYELFYDGLKKHVTFEFSYH